MSATSPLKDMSYLRARRRQARRRRLALRTDFALGVFVAAVALLLAPGVAIVALVALPVLAICVLSLVFERRRSRRGDPTALDKAPAEEPSRFPH